MGFVLFFMRDGHNLTVPQILSIIVVSNCWTFFPIAVALCLCGDLLKNKKIVFFCDISVVDILNEQSSTCPDIISVVTFAVHKSLQHNVLIRSKHLSWISNVCCRHFSRGV